MSEPKMDPPLSEVKAPNKTSEMNFVLQQVMYGHAPAASHLLLSVESWRFLTCGLCVCRNLVDKKEGTLLLMCKKPSLLYQAVGELEKEFGGDLQIYKEQPIKIVAEDEAEEAVVNVTGGLHQDPTFGEAYHFIVAHPVQRSTKPGVPVGLFQYMHKKPLWFGSLVDEGSGVLMIKGEVPASLQCGQPPE